MILPLTRESDLKMELIEAAADKLEKHDLVSLDFNYGARAVVAALKTQDTALEFFCRNLAEKDEYLQGLLDRIETLDQLFKTNFTTTN